MMNAKNCCAFVRVVQSNNGWIKPCGLDYGHGNHFASGSGFGFEEWMNSPLMEVESGKQLIHIEAFRIGFNSKNMGKPLYLWVYSKPKNLPSRKFLVGVIKNYRVLLEDEVQKFISENNIIRKLQDSIKNIENLDSRIINSASETIEKKLKCKKEKKFNLLVDKKDIKILPKVEWIELPSNVFRHKRFVAYFKWNEPLSRFLQNNINY
ncbi:MAG: hypothetical protein ACK5CL_06560 [Sphingomonadales bacterium]|jgi:hypothetical protein